MRYWAVLLCLLATADCTQQARAQPAWGLPQLMESLARFRGGSASFTEQQTSPVLSAPLITTGTLTYVAPDYLSKVTTSPVPESFVLEQDRVTLTGGSAEGTHVFAINQDPRIAGLVEGIRGTLAGDLPALEQFYTVNLSGSAGAWQLRLQPKQPALQRFVQSMVISGSEGRIAVIDTLSSDGSDATMRISAGDGTDAP